MRLAPVMQDVAEDVCPGFLDRLWLEEILSDELYTSVGKLLAPKLNDVRSRTRYARKSMRRTSLACSTTAGRSSTTATSSGYFLATDITMCPIPPPTSTTFEPGAILEKSKPVTLDEGSELKYRILRNPWHRHTFDNRVGPLRSGASSHSGRETSKATFVAWLLVPLIGGKGCLEGILRRTAFSGI